MELIRSAEALFQTPEQKITATITFRVFLDSAWRNIEGEASWKKLSQKELFAKLEDTYFAAKMRRAELQSNTVN